MALQIQPALEPVLGRLPLISLGPWILLGTNSSSRLSSPGSKSSSNCPDSASIARPSRSTRIFFPSAYSLSSVSGSVHPAQLFRQRMHRPPDLLRRHLALAQLDQRAQRQQFAETIDGHRLHQFLPFPSS